MPKDMSFLPEDYLQKRIARRTNVICLALFVVVMGGVVAAYFVTDRQRSEVRGLQAQVNNQYEEAARRLEQLQKLQEQRKAMIHKANVTTALVERVPRTILLAEMINHMPASLSLLELNLETKELRATARPRTSMDRAKQKQKAKMLAKVEEVKVPKTQMTVQLIGVAPTDVEVAKFMTSLSLHPLFADVNLQYSESTKIDDQPMRKFRVEMVINQDHDTKSMEPTMVRRGLQANPMGDMIQFNEQGQQVAPETGVVPVLDTTPNRKGN